ncbi:MAG TPA: FAD-dependent oxidoreductase, partial [Fodinibius sp.]|nr:FAD-dependent oxidoreductase [Fodinibius sp.]
AKQAEQKRHRNMEAAENVDLYLGHSVYEVNTEGKQIQSVDALELETGIRRRFSAPVFIDSTGDGWIGYWAGADYRYGRESRHEFDEGWEQHGDLWSPDKPDNRVMGSSVLWRTVERDEPVQFPDVPWTKPVAKSHKAMKGTWHWEYSDNDMHQVDNAEDIRDHMLRAIYGSFANAKKEPKHARMDLEWVSHLVGKRESRRLMGDYIYTMNDAAQSRKFPDTVVTEERSIDVHYQRKLRGLSVDFLAEAMFMKPKDGEYYLPFRSLYSKDISNLMMAGRCFSCSHIGLGGPRVMNTCGQMGVAVGYAAHLCLENNTTPRGVGKNHISELRQLCGYDSDKA